MISEPLEFLKVGSWEFIVDSWSREDIIGTFLLRGGVSELCIYMYGRG